MCHPVSTSIILGALALVPSTTSGLHLPPPYLSLHITRVQRRSSPSSKIFWNTPRLRRAMRGIIWRWLTLGVICSRLNYLHPRSSPTCWRCAMRRGRLTSKVFQQLSRPSASAQRRRREAKEIQTAIMMLLVIEEGRQRKLTEGIKVLQEVLGVVARSPFSLLQIQGYESSQNLKIAAHALPQSRKVVVV
ncbi:hypothetical protein B0H13DRAFT_2295684 [Mycena leptocephala]|nr:hypothetical protein B0H13DRAFT_2295684 [Mycena leptocephala]